MTDPSFAVLCPPSTPPPVSWQYYAQLQAELAATRDVLQQREDELAVVDDAWRRDAAALRASRADVARLHDAVDPSGQIERLKAELERSDFRRARESEEASEERRRLASDLAGISDQYDGLSRQYDHMVDEMQTEVGRWRAVAEQAEHGRRVAERTVDQIRKEASLAQRALAAEVESLRERALGYEMERAKAAEEMKGLRVRVVAAKTEAESRGRQIERLEAENGAWRREVEGLREVVGRSRKAVEVLDPEGELWVSVLDVVQRLQDASAEVVATSRKGERETSREQIPLP